jgi:hypothetical protein
MPFFSALTVLPSSPRSCRSPLTQSWETLRAFLSLIWAVTITPWPCFLHHICPQLFKLSLIMSISFYKLFEILVLQNKAQSSQHAKLFRVWEQASSWHFCHLLTQAPSTTTETHPNTHKGHKTQQPPNLFPHQSLFLPLLLVLPLPITQISLF